VVCREAEDNPSPRPAAILEHRREREAPKVAARAAVGGPRGVGAYVGPGVLGGAWCWHRCGSEEGRGSGAGVGAESGRELTLGPDGGLSIHREMLGDKVGLNPPLSLSFNALCSSALLNPSSSTLLSLSCDSTLASSLLVDAQPLCTSGPSLNLWTPLPL